MAPLGRIEDGSRPARSRQCVQPAQDSGPTASDGDEVDASLIDSRQLGVIDELGIEIEPLGIAVRDQGQRISISLDSQYFGEELVIETAPNHLAS